MKYNNNRGLILKNEYYYYYTVNAINRVLNNKKLLCVTITETSFG